MVDNQPASATVLAELDSAAGEPAYILIRGNTGSGKTALVRALREQFRRNGRQVSGTIGPGALVLLDDAHSLSAGDLTSLTDLVRDGSASVVLAVRPRPHDAQLDSLTAEIARRGSIVELADGTGADPTALPRAVRTALVLAGLGGGLDPDELRDVGGMQDIPNAWSAIDDAHASGLLGPDRTLAPTTMRQLRSSLGEHTFLDLARRILDYRTARDGLTATVAVRLGELGVRDPRLADYLCAAAESAHPGEASRVLDAAVSAGADGATLAARRSVAAAAAGDLARAQSFADIVLHDSSDGAHLADAVRVSAAVWARRGAMSRSAQLYDWLGPDRAGRDSGIAAAILLATGNAESAARFRATASGPPTDYVAGVAALGDGMLASLTESPRIAVNTLARAASMLAGSADRVLPIAPAAAAALLAIHTGDLDRADALVTRALSAPGIDGCQFALLRGWIAMLAGRNDAAVAVPPPDHDGPARERLFGCALQVGLARRSGDHGALVRAWTAATDVLDEVSVDLLLLLPLGELWLAAVRVGEVERISHLVEEAATLLRALQDPPAWASTFHWYGVQAAILAERPADLVPHAQSLGRAAAADPTRAYTSTLATAGRTWLRVLQGDVECGAVEHSARELAAMGLSWDGGRLAGEAALRVTDTAAATALLHVARSMRPDRPAAVTATQPVAAEGALSGREGEVAELLVLGLTYREVGARLYISAKTVEHHVARIRRRLGAGSRSELLSMLRAMGYGQSEGSQLV